nr:hypothetical protein [Mammaliicoccus lentus]
MPTIKRKVEMNLIELIDWAWENIEQVRGKDFKSHIKDMLGDYSTVQFSVDGYGFKTNRVSYDDTFTVEVEEEITEDTQISNLRHLTVYCFTNTTHTRSIKEVKDDNSLAFYIMKTN